jgi:hypothetical protein
MASRFEQLPSPLTKRDTALSPRPALPVLCTGPPGQLVILRYTVGFDNSTYLTVWYPTVRAFQGSLCEKRGTNIN